ncbi:hypothetical protein I5370_04470 [Citrobacter sp. FDAARGOS_156]|uniref:hypothetical protein n=1 Tax=Citrobacter sp. FDAARGOS_156 TaxID=1702170 RepID=UPI00190241BF|nr:hypothetical protein [Citrobacter sp. FDAARGOS_156]
MSVKQTYEELAVQLANAESKCMDLAADNEKAMESLKQADSAVKLAHEKFSALADENMALKSGHYNGMVLPETPATDAFLAEVRAQAHNEGINYAAGRLAAAFNHGFVDKPLTEVCDVVRMILDTKEELANSTLPAADGISGEYAEKFLAEFATQLRKGVQS